MAKKLVYNGSLGPNQVTFGEAGVFTKGVPVLVEDDALAAKLLAKGAVTEVAAPAAARSSKSTTTEE